MPIALCALPGERTVPAAGAEVAVGGDHDRAGVEGVVGGGRGRARLTGVELDLGDDHLVQPEDGLLEARDGVRRADQAVVAVDVPRVDGDRRDAAIGVAQPGVAGDLGRRRGAVAALVARIAVAGQVGGDRDVIRRVEQHVRRAHAGVEQADPARRLAEVEVRIGEDLRPGVIHVVGRVGVGGRLGGAVGQLEVLDLVGVGELADGLQRQAGVHALDEPVGVEHLAAELLELGRLALVEPGALALEALDDRPRPA